MAKTLYFRPSFSRNELDRSNTAEPRVSVLVSLRARTQRQLLLKPLLKSTRTSKRRAFIDLGVFSILLFGFACVSMRPVSVVAVPDADSDAYGRAQSRLRESQTDRTSEARDEARREAQHAVNLAPDWVAPQRLLDDLLRDELLGLEALSAHHQVLAKQESNAQALYLAGRLEGAQGAARFERAVLADPELAWGHHGLAWEAIAHARHQDALRYGRQALARARDPWERGFFRGAIARYQAAAGDVEAGIATLHGALADEDLNEHQRIELRVQLATFELRLVELPGRMRGFRRALALIRRESLTEVELTLLVERVRRSVVATGYSLLELQAALAEDRGEVRDRLRGELLLEEAPTPLALGLLESSLRQSGELESGGALLRQARFAAGQFSAGTGAWLRGLPQVVIGEGGLPKDEALRAVVMSAKALQTDGLVTAEIAALLTRLGDATLACGWFREARSVATELAAYDLDAALSIEARSLAGLELIQGIRRVVYRVDEDSSGEAGTLASRSGVDLGPFEFPEGSEADTLDISDLDTLLAAMGPMFARAHERLGGDANADHVRRALVKSPRFDYGFLGALIHPGPQFSSSDEEEERGTSGEPVTGLAQEMASIGRFALFGQMIGSKPDGSVLKTLFVEPRSGEHLGVPWRGTVAWCEGTDVLARAGRLGASLSGAALHEGYWVDIEVVRRDLASWNRLRTRFSRQGMRGRIDTVLQTRGVSLTPDPQNLSRYRRLRRSTSALLGESDRVRLAVMRDRVQAGEPLGAVTLDDLVEAVAVHEEGHLCDRERFLPITENMGSALRLLMAGGFSPNGVQRQLEYRAQLVALCEVSDPRLPLSDVLRGAEGGGSTTPHASAYAKLLGDLLLYIDRSYEREPETWPELDPGFTFAHQLHWLGPEQVRRASLMLARKRDLVD